MNELKVKDLELKGIAGWLAFVAVIIVLTPIYYGLIFFTNYLPLLTSPDFMSHYNGNEMLFRFLVLNLFALVVFFCFSIYILYLFFKKKSGYPSAQIAFNFILLIYGIAVVFMSKNLLDDNATLFTSGSSDLFKFIIWYLYSTKSIRVKNTFVN